MAVLFPARHVLSCFVGASALLACLTADTPADASPPFTVFESGQVRPLALSPDGKLLFAVNTPDNRLEIFRVKNHGLEHRASIPVGLEPVAVAARSNTEVWVVNHLSDSVSVVEIADGAHSGRVVRTLLVGDEPRDIVFAGPGKNRSFITTAHRGQNIPFDPQLTTPSVGRADVWVFNANNLGATLTGTPLTIVTLFSDTPRALAVTPDGSKVYAAAFHSGNRTTSIHEFLVPNGGETAEGLALPGPDTNFEFVPRPETGIILKFNGVYWADELGRDWDEHVRLSLPDKDVFVINANASPPALVPGAAGFYAGVGTILYNMAVNPVSGKVYVSNTEAGNEKRFEGPGIFAGQSIRGHLHESRITVLDAAGGVTPRHLNKHIDYETCCAPIPNTENQKSLALPQEMVVTSNGSTLYVATLGSSKIGVFNTAALENDTFTPNVADQIPVSGGGLTGLVLNEAKQRLYVMARFDNAISVIDTVSKAEIAHVAMHNPEPASVVAGRPFLYDASFSSSHGDSSCASCHVFGDFDSLAWDLGNPDAVVEPILGPLEVEPVPFGVPRALHPLKGPMTTQSLRGMANHGPMHWRGDRTGATEAEPGTQPDSGTFDEDAAFKKFQPGFTDLLGRSEFIPEADMQAFTDFILQVTYPPNPIRELSNQLTPDQEAGSSFFFNNASCFNVAATCGSCHKVDPNANDGVDSPGFFGTDGRQTFALESEVFKTPHLRNAYQKIGMFGMPENAFFPESDLHMGDQVRGFGFNNEGGVPTIFRFLRSFFPDSGIPNPGQPAGFPDNGPIGDAMRRQVEQFVLAFPTNLAPIVGQQVTLTDTNGAVVGARIDLMIARADVGECDLVVKGRRHHDEEGFVYVGSGLFVGNRLCDGSISDTDLRQRASHVGRELTYTCGPPGSGERMGIDRDGDGFRDGDEEDADSDPADAASTP